MIYFTNNNIIAILLSSASIHAISDTVADLAVDVFAANDPDPSYVVSRRLDHRSSASFMSFDLLTGSSKSGKASAKEDSLFTRHLVNVDELERELHHKSESFSYDSFFGSKSGKATGGRRIIDVDDMDRQLHHKTGSFPYDIYGVGKSGKTTGGSGGRRVLYLNEFNRELNHIMSSMSLGEVKVAKSSKTSKVSSQSLGPKTVGKSHKGKQVRRFLDVEDFDMEREELASLSMSIEPIVAPKSQKGAVVFVKEGKSKKATTDNNWQGTLIEMEEGDVSLKGKSKSHAILDVTMTSNKSGKSQKEVPTGAMTRSSTSDGSEGDKYQSYIEMRSSSVSAAMNGLNAADGSNGNAGNDATSSACVRSGLAVMSLFFLVVVAHVVF